MQSHRISRACTPSEPQFCTASASDTDLQVSLVSAISRCSSLLLSTAPMLSAFSAPSCTGQTQSHAAPGPARTLPPRRARCPGCCRPYLLRQELAAELLPLADLLQAAVHGLFMVCSWPVHGPLRRAPAAAVTSPARHFRAAQPAGKCRLPGAAGPVQVCK